MDKALILAAGLKTLRERVDVLAATSAALSGKDGAKGLSGASGAKGLDGAPGLKGMTGSAGYNGRDGVNGKEGVPGTDGLSVVDAEVDIDGTLSLTLSDGSSIKTTTEIVGPKGERGERGPPGISDTGGGGGATGPAGPTGATGPAGAAATVSAGTATGLTTGSPPTVTNSGTTSAAVFNFGIPAGAQGTTGTTGTAATIAAGTATALATGSAPTVTNSGTASAAVFNFGIPTGATGATGPTGPAGSGGGSVTSVSVATANGVSGTVATPTTTPAITLVLGAITPSSVAATGAVSGSNLSGTNTGDQTTITGNAGSATTATTSTNLSGGSGGSIPYQSSASTTAMLGNGLAGQLLSSNGTTLAPSWVTAGGTGTVTSVTSANANITVATGTTTPVLTIVQAPALASATSTVSVSASAAPTTGQVLTATSGTAATWQTPAGGSSNTATTEFNIPVVLAPAVPAANTVSIFGRAIAGGVLPAYIGPSGLDSALQPFLARNKVGFWCPPGNATTIPGVLGFTAYTAVGTATARNVATTNVFTRMRRLGYVSVATAAGLSSARVAVAQITLGATVGSVVVGGFRKVIRFGVSDAATVAGARQFVGISSSTAAPTNVEPSTLLNSIGVGHGAADSTLSIYYGGSAAQTPISLGVNFPANTLSADVYELALFCAPGAITVGWQVTRLTTGDTASGTLSGALGTVLPAQATLLSYSWNYRTNNATALAVGLDIFSDYIETDQ
jgi:hypothetical protein